MNAEPPIRLKTLAEHNAQVEAAVEAQYRKDVSEWCDSGVLCDKCKASGVTVQMKFQPWEGNDYNYHFYRPLDPQVICPNCLGKEKFSPPKVRTVISTKTTMALDGEWLTKHYSDGKIETEWAASPKTITEPRRELPNVLPKPKLKLGAQLGKYFWHLLAFAAVEFCFLLVKELMRTPPQ